MKPTPKQPDLTSGRTKVGRAARATRGLRGTYVPPGTRTLTRDMYYMTRVQEQCQHDTWMEAGEYEGEWIDGGWVYCPRRDTVPTIVGFMCPVHRARWRPDLGPDVVVKQRRRRRTGKQSPHRVVRVKPGGRQ